MHGSHAPLLPRYHPRVLPLSTARAADEESVKSALIAAFGNSNRAAEFLMTGIPEGALAAGYAHGSGSSGASRARAAPRAPADSSDPLAALRAHPQINELKSIVRSDPTKMPDVLKMIGGAFPASV